MVNAIRKKKEINEVDKFIRDSNIVPATYSASKGLCKYAKQESTGLADYQQGLMNCHFFSHDIGLV